ncbi:LysE family translocator [Pseudoruegeria sp. SHC-113]|uniref:LysE family translocator n=1 Tax=Pseudoruegeria sp. SHC-113 TaxID=2855439 RepID=UPI0021BAB890|nr:LysE family translocator [Pseudoruegeria sp. SHC-113]MCT8158998.1 LysE family translocator [Pseudoruegeria sp. SHC-113]
MQQTTLALLLFLFPLAYSPGPGNLFFAGIGARFGVKASLPASAGYHLATFALTLSIGLGFSGLLHASPLLFQILRFAGAAYVLWLAVGFLRAGAERGEAQARKASAWDGAVLLLLNPKAWVIIALMFTQFLPASQPPEPARVVWIASVFTLNNLVAFTLWTCAGDLLLRRFRNPDKARWMNIALGVMLLAVALWLLLR